MEKFYDDFIRPLIVFWKITGVSVSIYNDKGHIIIFDSCLNYLDKTLFEIKGDFTENEKNELNSIINFKEGYQLYL